MSIEKVFSAAAESYDRDRKILIPCYNDFYGTCLDVIPFHKDRELRVLDLGAGTGLLTAHVSTRYPFAQFALIDISPQMLEIAETRFKKVDNPGRYSFHVADYTSEKIKGTYDLVMSALSIHHLDPSEKQQLFEKVYDILEPGGFFINGDQVLGESEMAEKKFRHSWLEQVRQRGASESTIQQALTRTEEDRLSTLSDQLMWLEKAQFIDVTNWYQNYSFVVYSGAKPLV